MQPSPFTILDGRYRVSHVPGEIKVLDLTSRPLPVQTTSPYIRLPADGESARECGVVVLNWLLAHRRISGDEYNRGLSELPVETRAEETADIGKEPATSLAQFGATRR